ncbi:MAG: glycosyltransferase family 4 protein [Nitrospira sp.]|nr:glycosyltransferase family 4 protein [Nitrospira sp.]
MGIRKRILLVAYNFPPLISPQSLRWFYLCRELSRGGYLIDVLTIRMPTAFRDMVDDVSKEITIYRTFPGPFYYLTFKYSQESSKSEKSGMSVNHSTFWKILSGIHFKTYKILNNLFIPDIYSEWLPFAIKIGLNLTKTKKYDLIISSSEPRVCHLIGYFLKKKAGVPWIADYGDPWIYPVPISPEFKCKKKIIERIERNILKRVDAISVTSEGIKKLYLERYPSLNEERIHVVTQGFDPVMFSQVKKEMSSKFRIVYCGSFYKNLRDPMAFFKAIKEMDKENIEVIIAGRINEFADILKKEGLCEKIKYRGFLDHKESLALQKSATVLLHIGNFTDVQVPGKIYEYFGAERPILCIKGIDRDLSAELVKRYNKGIMADNKKEDITEGIMKLYELWQKGLLDASFNLDAVEDLTWRKRAEDISNIIKTL